jgi:hypothetical protein
MELTPGEPVVLTLKRPCPPALKEVPLPLVMDGGADGPLPEKL